MMRTDNIATRDNRDAEIARVLGHHLDHVLELFERSDIPYCILRNRDLIPASLATGSDVDIVIARALNIEQILRLLSNLRIVHVVNHSPPLKIFLAVDNFLLRLDLVNDDIRWLGFSYLDNQEILDHRLYECGIPVASFEYQAYDAWVGSLLWNGSFKDRYIDMIIDAAETRKRTFGALLRHGLGARVGREFQSLAEAGHPGDAATLVRRGRLSVALGDLKRSRGWCLIRTGEYAARRAGFRLRPPGLRVAVLGPDGVGKSMVCERLESCTLPHLPFDRVVVEHINRKVLPRLSAINRRRGGRGLAASSNPYAKPPHSAIVSVLAQIYYLCDQWLAEARWGRHDLARNWLRVSDRHAIDLLVDPLRYRFGASTRMARIVAWLSPKPDLTIVLDAPTRIVQERKHEVSQEETERQRQSYLKLSDEMRDVYLVDASQSVEVTVTRINQIIKDHLAKRTTQRFRIPTS